MELEEFDQNHEEFLRKNFKEPDYGQRSLPVCNEKALEYCCDLAELLVDVLTRYSKFNREPDYSVWEKSIPHEQFSEFVRSLFWATCGCITGFDGDTITVMHDGRGEKIMLYGGDRHERNQDFGIKAKHFTSSLMFGKVVYVDPAVEFSQIIN